MPSLRVCVDAAVEAGDGEGEDAEDDDADVAEGAVGGELLEVLLDEGDERAVDDADGSEGDHQRSDVARLRRGRCRRRSAGWSRGRVCRRGP